MTQPVQMPIVLPRHLTGALRRDYRRHLDSGGAQVLQAANHSYDPALKAATDQADASAAGQRRNCAPVFVVVEISETADDDDIDRAQERAAILQRAANQTAVAAVIGKEMSATNRQRAARREVTVIILGDR